MAITIAEFFNKIQNARSMTILAGQYEIRINDRDITHNFGDGFWHTMSHDNQIESVATNADAIVPEEIRILDKTGEKIMIIQNPTFIVLFK
jgi:hypothetical protein